MDVLKRINKLRLDRGWSVYRLSVESGLAQSTLINMFNRETLPSITTLENICAAFGITMAEFFSDPSEVANIAQVSEDEELITLYRALSPATRLAILSLMRTLAEEKAQ